jgi:NAD+ diphosphatase
MKTHGNLILASAFLSFLLKSVLPMLLSPNHFEPRLDLPFEPDSLVHLFHQDQYVNLSEGPEVMPWSRYRAAGFHAERVHSMGTLDGQPHFAVGLADDFAPSAISTPWRLGGLRSWFGILDDLSLSLAMRAVQVLEWDRTHRFCGTCGTPTTIAPGERAKRCPACKLTVYPRISPAMMVLVCKGRELLLARGVNFPPGRFSALAGFLEAGETIEQAVIREVREEVGVEVDRLEYFGSQSWPFPNSLMIAFRAQWVSGEISPDLNEIAEAHWYSPENLPQLPPRLSIARALIDSAIQGL